MPLTEPPRPRDYSHQSGPVRFAALAHANDEDPPRPDAGHVEQRHDLARLAGNVALLAQPAQRAA